MANKAVWIEQFPQAEEPVVEAEVQAESAEETEKKETHKREPMQVEFHVGDTVRVHYKLIEREKEAGKKKREVNEIVRERIQVFEGIVLSIRGRGKNLTFTVRKIASGAVGVERIFPIISPWIRKMEVKKYGKVRRSKLYYLRGRVGKAATRVDEARPTAAQ